MRRFTILISLLMVLTILTACAATPAAPAAEEQPTAAAPEAGAEKITLRFWSHQNPAFIAANEALIAKFMEENPDIEIKYEQFPYDVFIQTLQTSMPAGTEADVIEMFGTWVCSYAKGGRLAEVPEDIVSLAEAREVFFQAPLDGYVCDGKLYGLPNEFNIEYGGVLVNPVLFEEAGLAYPPKWDTWEELIADAQRLVKTEGGQMTVAGFHFVTGDGLPFLFFSEVLQRGGDYWADDQVHLKFITPQGQEALQFMVDLVQKYGVVDPVLFNGDTNWVGDAFFAGQVGIGFVGPWAAAEGLTQYPDMKFDYVAMPHHGDEPLFVADSGWGKVVSINSQHKDAAWKFAKFMTMNKENAEAWNVTTGTVPAIKSIAEERTILQKLTWIGPSLDILPYGRYIGDVKDRDRLWYDIMYNHILAALQGVETVDEALTAMEQEANAMIDEHIK
ncbi:MAG: hypothetical protein Kow0047_23780 [Anaerolineae bacterium]